ncbi:peptidoglycan-binding protein [Polaribacter sp. R77954]|uniref:peptidoglycan-binding protein n=1 Tax=Polaribacter sp. R77954 TaxID=3093870 RepID=UPI0037C6868C
MKQIIIFLLLVIASLIAYGVYSDYQRYNSPEVNYKTMKNIDTSYYNKALLFNYYQAIEDLDCFVMLQWSANKIDVKTPEDDDIETRLAVGTYANKLAKVTYYEAILQNSLRLKDKGLSNTEIKFIEEKGISLKTYQRQQKNNQIKALFNPNSKLYNGSKNAIVYEVQKELKNKGYKIEIDGVYRVETLNAIKQFEEKNSLLADGFLDKLTLDVLFQ